MTLSIERVKRSEARRMDVEDNVLIIWACGSAFASNESCNNCSICVGGESEGIHAMTLIVALF